MNSMARFNDTELPPQSAFFSRLNGEPLSDADYQHALNVWDKFSSQYETMTMRNYHDIYLKADVLLLVDVFEKFRHDSQTLYGLEPVRYYSLPGIVYN